MGFAVGGDDLYEIIDGHRVAKGPQTVFAAWLASELCFYLGTFVRSNELGHVVVKGLFQLPESIHRSRRPDVAFVSYERWPRDRPISPTADAWDVVPNVAAEVVSPTDSVKELDVKISEYFRAGVELVWVLYPPQCKIHVYESPTKVQILTTADVLDGGTVVPGFRLPLEQLFSPGGNGKK